MPEEVVDARGRVPVDETAFVPELEGEGEEGHEEVPENNGEEGGEQPTGEEPEGEEGGEQPEPTKVDPEKGGEEGAEGERPEGQLYANKYKTVEELRRGFVNLGGNPNKYKTPEALEEAYEVRNAEMRRIQNENGERARLETTVNTNPTPGQGDNTQEIESLLDKVNWDKVGNARDLGRELLGLMRQAQPTAEVPSAQDLVQQALPIIEQRQAAQRELNELEAEIPNLRYVEGEENEFRNAFATFVLGEKRSGQYENLKASMKKFLQWNERMVQEAARIKGLGREAKADAASVTERGTGLPEKTDEADEVIGAWKKQQERLGLGGAEE